MKTNNKYYLDQHNNVLTYEINNAVDAMKIRFALNNNQYNSTNNLNKANDCFDIKQNGQLNNNLNQLNIQHKSKDDDAFQNINYSNSTTDYNLASQSNRLHSFNKNNGNQFHLRKKPFIDRSYENDNELLGLKNKLNYSAKENKAIEDINCKSYPEIDIIKENNSKVYYNSNNDFNKEEIITILKKLPPNQQVVFLLNENKKLKEKVEENKRAIEELTLLNNKTVGLISTNKEFKDYFIKENKDLSNLNKNYENIIEILIHFLNQLKQIAEGKPLSKNNDNLKDKKDIINLLSLNEIKNNPSIVKAFLHNLNLSNHHKKKAMERYRNRSKRSSHSNQSDNSYDYISSERITNCLPCALGLNNSNKGYSPLLCSPNRLKYIKRSQTPI